MEFNDAADDSRFEWNLNVIQLLYIRIINWFIR